MYPAGQVQTPESDPVLLSMPGVHWAFSPHGLGLQRSSLVNWRQLT